MALTEREKQILRLKKDGNHSDYQIARAQEENAQRYSLKKERTKKT